jgi:hypothetical protein
MKKNVIGWACGTYGGERNAHRVLVGKPERKRPLERPTHTSKIILKWTSNRTGQCGLDKSDSG